MGSPILKVLSIRPFLFLLLAEFFSQVAANLLTFSLLLVVFSISQSNTAVAGVVLTFTLPSLFLGILAGVYVDRWNKKNVLIWTNLLRGLAILPLILISDSIWIVYLISFVVSLITQFFIPAETPMIPLLVKRKLLMPANALFGMGIFGSIIVAYAASGPLILFLGVQNLFILLILFFAIASIFSILIKLTSSKVKDRKEKGVKTELYAAVRLVMGSKRISHSLVMLALIQTLVFVVAVIGPGYAQNVLGLRIEEFPLIFVTPAVIGMVIGGVILGNFFTKISREKIRRLGLMLVGAVFLIFPQAPAIVESSIPSLFSLSMTDVLAILSGILGFSMSLVFIPSNTVLQEETTDSQRGKIYGILNTMTGAISIIPVLTVGALADIFGVVKVLTMIGFFMIALVVIRFLMRS